MTGSPSLEYPSPPIHDTAAAGFAVTVSLLSDPSRFVTTTYVLDASIDLSVGTVGIRSHYNNAMYDNFTVVVEQMPAEDAAATVNGQYFATVQGALDAANGSVVKILKDSEEAITVSGGIIDLAGQVLSDVTVTEGAELKLIDSATDDYEGEYGSAKITGSVVGGENYLLVQEGGAYSAHAYAVKITHISLDAANDALGYKAQFLGDSVAMSHVKSVGINLGLDEGKVITRTIQGKREFTLRLKNILANNGGEMDIHATAFVTFSVNGETYTKTCGQQTTSMKQTLQYVDAAWSGYTEAQQTAVKDLCSKFYDVVSLWDLKNIFPIIDIPITE